jgi:hypothetical protein
VLSRAEATASVEVVFPFAAVGDVTARIPAQLVTPDVVDVGMLDLVLESEPLGWLPTAVPLSPQRRVP